MRFASALEQNVEVIARGVQFRIDGVAVTIAEHLNESYEQIVGAISKLLNIRVLFGRVPISQHGDSLINHVYIEIQSFAERCHK